MGRLTDQEFQGVNVTIPYKTAVVAMMNKLSPESKDIGAVNTIHQKDGCLTGYNTDATGFSRSLLESYGNPKNKKCVVLGSGGVARAVVFSLARFHVAKIWLLTRDIEKTYALINDMKKHHPDLAIESLDRTNFPADASNTDILINATPSGMKPSDKPYIDFKHINKNMFVYDLIYNPPETALLIAAKKRGCKILNGMDMLLYQGAESFNIWTGVDPPLDVMREALKESFL